MSSYILFFLLLCTACVRQYPSDLPRSAFNQNQSFSPRSGEYYLVKKGDSLWKISKHYGVSVNTIMRENKINSATNLKTGQTLFIPISRKKTNVISFFWPTKGKIISAYGESINGIPNKGLNIQTSTSDNVKASAGGRIVFSDYLKGWGETLVLEHPADFYTIYANLRNISVKENEIVTPGQILANIAPSGAEKNYILHFEIRKKYLPQNPLQYLE